MKYIQFTEADAFKDKPLFVRAEQITEFLDNKIYVGTGCYMVRETAQEIYDKLQAFEVMNGSI